MVQGVWVAREEYGGWLHVYSLILAVAVFLTISVIAFRFWRRRLPWRSFELGVLITLPFGVLGASFFGKLDVKHPIFFPTLFAFWQPGLSIHGGILVGAGAGFIFYHFESKRYLISKWVYCDAIFPAIFLGQAVGRWGNFFNHELFGPKISYGALKWWPAFLRNSLFRW